MAQYEVEGPDGSRYLVEGPDGPGTLETAGASTKRFGANVVAGFGKMASEAPRVASWFAAPWESPTANASRRSLTDAADFGKDFFERFGKEHGSGPGFSQSIGESIGGGMAAGGLTPSAVAAAAGSGAGSEASARMFGDNFLTRLIGGLAGGGVTAGALGAAARRTPNAEALAREALQGITPKQLDEAGAFQAAQRANGINIDLAQALEAVGAPASNITTIRNFLANKPQGDKVQTTLREQPGQLSLEAGQAVARMPGTNYGFNQAANNLQEAATKAVNQVKGQRSAAVKPLYAAAGVMAPGQVKEIEDLVRSIASQPGTTDDVTRAAGVFLDKLRGGQNQLMEKVSEARAAVAGAGDAKSRLAAQKALEEANAALEAARNKPIMAADLDTWIGEMSGPFKGTPLSPVDPRAAGQMKGLAGAVNKKFQELSPEVRRAEEKFAELSETLVNPVKQSATGQIATPRGYKPDIQATMAKFNELLARGSDANAKVSDIATLGTQLAKVDKDAFADALKTFVSGKIRSAMEPGATGQTAANNPDMATRIAKSLWGSELQAQGLRDALAVAAKAQGMNPDDAVRGLNNLMQLTRAMQSRPSSVGGLMPEDIFRMGGRNVGADSLRVFGFLPFERAARRLEDTVMGKTLTQFDTILTSKDGIKMLSDLGRESVLSRKIPVLLGQFGAQATTNPAGIMPE